MHTAIPKIAIPKDHRQHQRQVAAGGGAPTVTLTLTKGNSGLQNSSLQDSSSFGIYQGRREGGIRRTCPPPKKFPC